MTALYPQKALVSGCNHCDVDIVNQMPQIRHIGYRYAVALSSPLFQITADMPIIEVRYQYRHDTNYNYCVGKGRCSLQAGFLKIRCMSGFCTLEVGTR